MLLLFYSLSAVHLHSLTQERNCQALVLWQCQVSVLTGLNILSSILVFHCFYCFLAEFLIWEDPLALLAPGGAGVILLGWVALRWFCGASRAGAPGVSVAPCAQGPAQHLPRPPLGCSRAASTLLGTPVLLVGQGDVAHPLARARARGSCLHNGKTCTGVFWLLC